MDAKFFMQVTVPLSILIPIFIGITKFKMLTKPAKVVLCYMVASAITNGISIFISKQWHMNNMPLVHLYTVIELILIVIFYKRVFEAPAKMSFFTLIVISFTVLCVVNALYFQSIYTYNSYTRSLEAIICILFAMNYFARIAASPSVRKLIKEPNFYFNTGFFLYFSGAFMLFIFSNFVIKNLANHDFLIIWAIHAALILLMNLLFSIGFLLCKK